MLLVSNGKRILSNVNVVVYCEGTLKVKIAHFWLPSVSEKRACLSYIVVTNQFINVLKTAIVINTLLLHKQL